MTQRDVLMRRVILVVFATVFLGGCVSRTRTSIPRDESHHVWTVPNELSRDVAFRRVERALASVYEDLPQVLQSKHAESGTFVLEPLVTYKVGGPMGKLQHARYRLEIVARDRAIDFSFDLGPDVSSGAWAPESEIPYIRNDFRSVATQVAEAVVAQ